MEPVKLRMGGAKMRRRDAQLSGLAMEMRVFMGLCLGFVREHDFSEDYVKDGGGDPCGDD
jgi:hypothetical protein